MTTNGSLFLDWHTDDGAASHLLVLPFDYDHAPVSGICRGVLDGIAEGTRSVVDGLAHFLLLGLGVLVGQHALLLPSRASSFLPTLLRAGLLFGALAALLLLEEAFREHAAGGLSPVVLRGARDNRMARPVELRGSADYLVSAELGDEIVGGRCALTATVGGFPPKTVQFFIRGKNPRDAVARAYIDAHVDAEFRDFAWMIAKHESRAASTRQIYNQFNPSGNKKELPNLGAPDGWGMCQIDKGQYGDSTAEVYDWHANVASMNVVLRDKRDDYTKFTRHYRNTYGGHQSWVEPENYTRTIQGCVVSAKTWAIMVLYNGAASVPVQEVDGHRFQSPIEFVPGSSAGTGQWIFHDNVSTYGNVIMAEQSQSSVE